MDRWLQGECIDREENVVDMGVAAAVIDDFYSAAPVHLARTNDLHGKPCVHSLWHNWTQ